MPTVTVTHEPQAHRYVAHVEGRQAGFAEYQLTDELVVFTHTEVADECEGMGVASALARSALDDVRETGTHRVLPLCPFIKAWIGKHPDYRDLVYRQPVGNARD